MPETMTAIPLASLSEPRADVPTEPPTARRMGAPIPLYGRAEEPRYLTPAGLQDKRDLATRRAIVIGLNAATIALLTWGVGSVFGAGGWTAMDVIIMACFLIGVPWTTLGLWNALIGFWLLHGVRDGVARVAPHAAAAEGEGPITSRVAVAMTVRNEPPLRSFERLAEIRRSLDATGHGQHFDVFILSDTTEPEIAAEEDRLFQTMRAQLGARAVYRRRETNTAFKAGNVRDFLATLGREHDLYLPLDSDSLMSGPAILRMVRIMEAHPRIGILQSLVVGSPASSFFARVFQFGMRHGMRSYTMGAAWWQGDCGPYWGHNALIRIPPFRRHCHLPKLPGRPPLGGHVLSHDQIEAVLMRRAGWEVRVLPVEGESWEDNPPTLMDYTKRDLRWCQGNMQYWPLLRLKGLRPTSRFQIVAAIMMYLGAPAWMLMTLAAAGKMFDGENASIDITFGIAMFFVMFSVSLVPKLMGMLDIACTRGGAARYGGRLRFAAGAVTEILFSMLMAPVVACRVTIFMVGLAFGKSVIWGAQIRDAYRLTWGDAARGLWPQTLFGIALFVAIGVFAGWNVTVWAAPMILGLGLSIPFAVLSADPRLGAWAVRNRLCAIPDEITVPETIARLAARAEGAPDMEAPKAA